MPGRGRPKKNPIDRLKSIMQYPMFTRPWFGMIAERVVIGLWLALVTLSKAVGTFIRKNWRETIAFSALVLLATSASYGVYVFSLLFVPHIFALVTACAFEATYIGLGVAQLRGEQRIHAHYISVAAVAVSVAYNTIAALIHLFPTGVATILAALATATGGALFGLWFLVIIFSLLHGVPLAVTAYFLSNLILHKNDEGGEITNADAVITRMIALKHSDNAIFDVVGGNSAKTRETIKALRARAS